MKPGGGVHLARLEGQDRLYFAGAFERRLRHEYLVTSTVRIAERLARAGHDFDDRLLGRVLDAYLHVMWSNERVGSPAAAVLLSLHERNQRRYALCRARPNLPAEVEAAWRLGDWRAVFDVLHEADVALPVREACASR